MNLKDRNTKQGSYVSPFQPTVVGGKENAGSVSLSHPTVIPAIFWNGENLDEMVSFCGNSELWKRWFGSWSEYETYVHEHGDVFKIFIGNGNDHILVPKGSWVVRTPDGVCHTLGGTIVEGK